jgi:acyl dehydratase/quercetin dioxygenase-like cupin family protein
MSLFFEDFVPGGRYRTGSRLITDADHDAFCRLAGYTIPLFLDDAYARQRGLPGRICPSHLVMSFSTAMTSGLLSDSVIALAGIENARFHSVVRPGDEIRTEIEVISARPTSRTDRGLVVLRDRVFNQRGDLVFQNDKHALVRRRTAPESAAFTEHDARTDGASAAGTRPGEPVMSTQAPLPGQAGTPPAARGGAHHDAEYIVRGDALTWYSPADHTGTRNARLVSEALNGARHMEVVLGEVTHGAGVSLHAHPGMEQAQYFLEGEAEVEIDGEKQQVRAGDLCFFPADVFHSVRVTGERMRVLIIYAPPYAESPDKVVRKPG